MVGCLQNDHDGLNELKNESHELQNYWYNKYVSQIYDNFDEMSDQSLATTWRMPDDCLGGLLPTNYVYLTAKTRQL